MTWVSQFCSLRSSGLHKRTTSAVNFGPRGFQSGGNQRISPMNRKPRLATVRMDTCSLPVLPIPRRAALILLVRWWWFTGRKAHRIAPRQWFSESFIDPNETTIGIRATGTVFVGCRGSGSEHPHTSGFRDCEPGDCDLLQKAGVRLPGWSIPYDSHD
jgi:hypothetical protein